MTEVNVTNALDEPRYMVYEVTFGDMQPGRGGPICELKFVFNGGSSILAASKENNDTGTGGQYVEMWPEDRQIDDLITALSFYRKQKQELGKWEAITDE